MTEVYLKLNQETKRYECYHVVTDEYVQTLTCGDWFMLIPDDEDLEVPWRIEYSNSSGYYWIDSGDSTRQQLMDGLKGYVA